MSASLAGFNPASSRWARMNRSNSVRGHVSFLTAAPHPGSGGFRNSISLDQYIATRIGNQTRFPSLTLGVNAKEGRRVPTRVPAMVRAGDFATTMRPASRSRRTSSAAVAPRSSRRFRSRRRNQPASPPQEFPSRVQAASCCWAHPIQARVSFWHP